MLMEVIKDRYREGKVPVHFLLDFLQNKFYKDSDVHQWHISEVRNIFWGRPRWMAGTRLSLDDTH